MTNIILKVPWHFLSSYTARFDKVVLDKVVELVSDLPDPEVGCFDFISAIIFPKNSRSNSVLFCVDITINDLISSWLNYQMSNFTSNLNC